MAFLSLEVKTPDFDARYDGTTEMNLDPGRQVEFKTFGGGPVDKFFEKTVPSGKKWRMVVIVSIIETNF